MPDWRAILIAVILLYVLVNAFFIIFYSVRVKRSRKRMKNIEETVSGLHEELEDLGRELKFK